MNEDIPNEPIEPTEPGVTEVTDEAAPTEVVAPTLPTVVTEKPKRNRKKLLLITTAVIVVILLVGGAFLLGRSHNNPKPATVTSTAKKAGPKPTVTKTASFSINFLETPQLLSPQPNFFKDLSGLGCDDASTGGGITCDITYSKIGTTKEGQDVIYVENGLGGPAGQSYLALKTGADQYAILVNPDGTINSDNVATTSPGILAKLNPNITIDTKTRLTDLTFNPNATIKGIDMTNKDPNDGYVTAGYVMTKGLTSLRGSYMGAVDVSKIAKLGTYKSYSVYQVTATEGTNYKVEELYLTINNVYATNYKLVSPFIATKLAPTIKWADGSSNTDTFTYRAPGCGSFSGYQVAKGVDESSLTKTGTGPNGEVLYKLDTSSALFQEVYNDYGSGDYLDDANLKNLTADQFQAKHGVFLSKNGLGELVIYENAKLLSGGGCGKPVVYLYPTQATKVNVAVGAIVRKSAPTYPAGGWKQVLAQPNGQLTYQGQQYPNLYWEGTGYGEYPIVDSGTVVAAKDAPATIRKQLTEQGLNNTEIGDFLDFWQPKLPHTAYVRLTWFNTQQMNELAPLSILPRPDTTIRVFLDFQGLNRQISLAPQHLSSTPRLGFTAVEWGGLERF